MPILISTQATTTAGLDWGSLADWLGAIGTTGALFATFIALRREQRIRRKQERDDEARQAQLVLCWVDTDGARIESTIVQGTTINFGDAHFQGTLNISTSPTDQQPMTPPLETSGNVNVVIRNASDREILNCNIFVDSDTETEGQEISRQRVRNHSTRRMLPPGTNRISMPIPADLASYAIVELVFTDTNGRVWKRLSTGELERLLTFGEESTLLQRLGKSFMDHLRTGIRSIWRRVRRGPQRLYREKPAKSNKLIH